MNILVIGNGFDLAHGLPTKYTDFLEFIKIINQIYNTKKQNNIDFGKVHPKIKTIIEEKCGNVRDNLFSQEFVWKELVDNNVWIEYFLQCDMHGKENWIDFESEIAEVIKSLDADMNSDDFYKTIYSLSNKFFNDKYTNNVPEYLSAMYQNEQEKIRKREISFKELRDILCRDLDKLIRAFEIYLTQYIEKIAVNCVTPDIEGIEVDKVLSFNYTNIFEELYGDKQSIEYDYIHGKADFHNTLQTNNMVLGIDEYLEDDRKNKDIEFIAFKKFYQRIHKQTGCKYKEWVDEICKDRQLFVNSLEQDYSKQVPFESFVEEIQHNLFIFGHSLDETDKDVLRDLILNDNVYTTIYYRKQFDNNGNHDNGRNDLGSKIANLVKVIGQEEVIRRTGGSTKTIEFRLQQDMELK